jgi:hypothetical protein
MRRHQDVARQLHLGHTRLLQGAGQGGNWLLEAVAIWQGGKQVRTLQQVGMQSAQCFIPCQEICNFLWNSSRASHPHRQLSGTSASLLDSTHLE